MKKLINLTLIITPILLLFFLLISFWVQVVSNDWEIRKSWVSTALNSSIAMLFSIFFISLSIKTFISKRDGWINFLLFAFYILILFISVLAFLESRHLRWLGIPAIIALSVIILLFTFHGVKWKRIFFSVHSILFSLISVFFVIGFLAENKKDYFSEDKLILYKSVLDNKRVIAQGEGSDESEYLIKYDLGFIRKRTVFNGLLDDGVWQVFNKSGEIISVITIKDGIEINRENHIPDNSILVKSIADIRNNLHKKGITFLLDGNYQFNQSIELTHCSELKFEAIPGKIQSTLNTRYLPCFIIKNSSDISINDIDFISEGTESIIKIENSNNISIINSSLYGHSSVNYGIKINEQCKNVLIRNNEFRDIKTYAIQGYSNSTELSENEFYLGENYNLEKAVLILDKHYDEQTAIALIKDIILNYDEDYSNTDNSPTVQLFGKNYRDFKGTFSDLIFAYNVYSELDEFMVNDYCANCGCVSPYCSNLLEMISGEKLFIPEPVSQDNWCFDQENKPKFSFVNPKFFSWFSGKLNLDPDASIRNVKYSFIYTNLFQNIIRNYYAVYKQIHNNNINFELKASYKEFIDNINPESYTDLDLFLFNEFAKQSNNKIEYKFLTQTNIEDDRVKAGRFYQNSEIDLYETKIEIRNDNFISAKEYSQILSFWIRREIDGSAKALYNTFEYYLGRYDLEWFNNYQ